MKRMTKTISARKILEIEHRQDIFDVLLQLAETRKIYLVGGAIRDFILGRTACDFDLAVSGSGIDFTQRFAHKVKGAFVLLSEKDDEARVVLHKTITFDFNGYGSKTIHDDLVRRDFTINALAIDLRKPTHIIDDFAGLRHLKHKIVIPVSDDSLKLDPLRILRAFRLALELKFTVDKRVLFLTKEINLNDVAPERISYELLRISEASKSYAFIKLLYQLNLMQQIFPLANELLQNKELTGHSLRTYKKIESILTSKSYFSQFTDEYKEYFEDFPYRRALLKLAGLFHDIAKPHTQFTTDEGEMHFYGHDNLGAKLVGRLANEKLRLSRKQVQMLKTLVSYHMRLHLLATTRELTDRAIRRFFRDLDDEFFGLLILTYADGYATAKKTDHLERTITRMMRLKKADDSKKTVKRLITGDDLIAMGLKPGPSFKPILQELEELQLDGKIMTKEEGIEYIKLHFPQ
jgi:poly(A) polymerase